MGGSKKLILGIDFGTSNSCISYYNENHIIQIPNEIGSYINPTCIYFEENSDEILYGNVANEMLNKSNINQSNIIRNFKRLLGIQYEKYIMLNVLGNSNIDKSNNNSLCSIKIRRNSDYINYDVDKLIELYISYLIQLADDFIGIQVRDVVITIPAYFSDIQRTILKTCCENIGLQVIRILNEPTAAGLAYSFDNTFKKIKVDEENILVIDCGGGTTDISLLEIDYTNSFSTVIDVNGDNFLGGEDFTQYISEYIINNNNMIKTSENLTEKQLRKIKKASESAKISLTYNNNVSVYIENFTNDNDITINLSRTQFISICKPLFDKIRKIISDILYRNEDVEINKIILVGGTTRIPNFKVLLSDFFDENIIICDNLDPDSAISIGAAYQGALLYKLFENEEQNNSVLMDIVPFSLGIKTIGNVMTTIINKNTPMPVSKYEIFTNTEENIDSISIEIYQGERRFIKDNELLAVFELDNLDKTCKKNEMKIKVTFEVNSNGMIFVEAHEMKHGSKREIMVTKSYNKKTEIDELDNHDDLEDQNKILKVLEFKQILTFFQNNESNESSESNVMNKIKAIDDKLNNILEEYEKYTDDEINEYISNIKSILKIK